MSHRRVAATLLALAAVVALGACGGDGDDGRSAAAASTDTGSGKAPFEVKGEAVATSSVDLPKSYKFDPAVISITAGDDVTWTNNDNFPHNVKVFGGDEQTRDLPVGGTTSIAFDEAGTYYYQCTLHPSQMKGKILVEAG